ncbi:MAG TPA: LLM class flavin-dependent oxidoreductase, partial [Candidatus Limnocylindrales bacterium]
MKIGVIVPQGWTGEYNGWDAATAWTRTRDVAWQAEALGFESIWLFDHFHTTPRPTDEITFESFTSLAALAAQTRRVRIGHVVLCAAYRNAALTAKMISTLDVISDGRAELGIGAGWKRDEWLAYGYGFPAPPERLAILRDHLEVARAMMGPGRATYRGEHASVDGAINVPKPVQRPWVPIMVGGNGPNVTWRLAARYADELNVDGMTPSEVAEALPVIAARCAEIDRDPASLSVSVHAFWDHLAEPGQARVDLLGAYAELGLSRVIGLVRDSADSD